MMCTALNVFVCLFGFDATAPSGPEPPHSRGFSITVNVFNSPYLKGGARNDFLRLAYTHHI